MRPQLMTTMVLSVERIVDVRQSCVDTDRSLPAQSFVQTFVVEDIGEFVEASLLLEEVCRSRFGASFFKVRCMRS